LLAAGLFTDADRELQHVVRQLAGQRLSQDLAEAHLARAEAALLADRPTAARRHAARARTQFVRRDNPRWAARAELLGLRAAQLAGGLRAGGVLEEADRVHDRLASLGLAEDARIAAAVAARATLATGRMGVIDEVAVRLARATPRRSDRLDARLLWRLASADLATARGDDASARRHLSQGLAVLQDQRSRLGSVDLRTGAAVHGRALAATGLESAMRSGRISEIFAWSERARAQALLLPSVRPPGSELTAQVAELRGVQSALAQRELDGRSVAGLRSRRDKLERSLREQAWFAAGPAVSAQQVGLGRLRAGLGDAAMVIQLPLGRRLAALVLAGGRAHVVDLGDMTPALAAVRRLRADLDVGAGRLLSDGIAATVAEATRQDADAVARHLLGPLLSLVGDRDLVIVPTGALVTVPWPVLPPTRGRPVTVALSATTWSNARSRVVLHGLDARSSALLVAGPRIAQGDHEVAALARQLPASRVLTGAAATVEATLARLTDVDVAHLASHGHHAVDNALFSGLQLSDGMLMGYDVNALDQAPALVVLSACDVGRHDVRPGDESLGMATAFLGAGAGTVVAAVCRVADDLAPVVMESMYAALLAGRSCSSALAAAADNPGFVCFGAG